MMEDENSSEIFNSQPQANTNLTHFHNVPIPLVFHKIADNCNKLMGPNYNCKNQYLKS